MHATGVIELLTICALILGARGLYRLIPALRRLAIPPVLVAGFTALALGPSALDLLPLGEEPLKAVVYHGVAVVFIGMALSTRPRPAGEKPAGGWRARNRAVKSTAVMVTLAALLQGIWGLGFVLVWGLFSEPLHPGLGLMLPLGFSQGPGQSLSLGSAWEQMGFTNGAQVGLAVATFGYACCSVTGVALYHLGRIRGWIEGPGETVAHQSDDEGEASGGLEPLTAAAAMIGSVYLVTWMVLGVAARGLSHNPQLVAMVWGFHYLVGLVLAAVTRWALGRFLTKPLYDPAMTRRLGSLAVDLTAACAIAAVRIDALGDRVLPLILLGLSGAGLTGLACIWSARRAFPERPFAHVLALYGAFTGTLPTGLALLRLIDPELSGRTASDIITGITFSALLGAPILLFILPMPVMGWPGSYPTAVWQTLAALGGYGALLGAGWWASGGLRFEGRLWELWPTPSPAQEAASESAPT